jgi:hypothetical protein
MLAHTIQLRAEIEGVKQVESRDAVHIRHMQGVYSTFAHVLPNRPDVETYQVACDFRSFETDLCWNMQNVLQNQSLVSQGLGVWKQRVVERLYCQQETNTQDLSGRLVA